MNLKSLKHINNFYLVIFAISVTGFLLRLLGLNWDQGNLFHPDERQLLMISQKLSINNLDPNWYNYGTLPLYILELLSFGIDDLKTLRFPGRILSSLFDSISIFLIGELGKRFHSKLTGIISSIFYSTSVLALQLSHFFTVDTFLNTSIILIFLLCSNLIQKYNTKNLIYLSIALGVGFAIKISIFIIAVPVLITLIFSTKFKLNLSNFKVQNFLRLLVSIIIVGLISIVSFGLFNPYSIINLQEFINSSKIQSEMARGIIDFPYTRQYVNTTPYIYHISQLIKVSLGPFLGIFSIFSFTFILLKIKKTSNPLWFILLSWMISYFAFYGIVHTKFIRYLFPLIPIILIFNSYALVTLYKDYLYRFRKITLILFSIFIFASLHYFMSFILIFNSDHNANIAAKFVDDYFIENSILVKEHWDESLPFKSSFIIQEIPLYDSDTTTKIRNISSILSNSDGIFISSKRLIGTIPRLYERYPLTTNYYKKLLNGDLGFELVKQQSKNLNFLGIHYYSDPFNRVKNLNFENNNNLNFRINLGWTDESFTVYDHPEILIFKNSKNLTSQEIFDEIMIIDYENNLNSVNYDYDQNNLYKGKFQDNSILAIIIWLLTINVISLIFFPIIWKISLIINFKFNGHLKIISILFSAYLCWILVSLNLFEFTQINTYLILIIPLIISLYIFITNKKQLITYLGGNYKNIVKFNRIFLISFLIFVFLRSLNPDLWHPYRGGEKPMELSYLSAILNSSNLPPLDPWFSGSAMNYYYFGLFIFGYLINLTQISTFIGFNLAVCTVFALSTTSLFAFSETIFNKKKSFSFLMIFMVLIMSNMQPMMQVINKISNLNFSELFNIDYWQPSRVFPTESIGYEISEFPFFSFLFADLHPHMISIPIYIFFLTLLVSIFTQEIRKLNSVNFIVTSGITISFFAGILWVTNTWTVPVIFFLINILGLLFFQKRYNFYLFKSLAYSSFILIFSYLLFLPFHNSFSSPVSGFEISEFKTNLNEFIEIYFVFIISIFIYFLAFMNREFTKRVLKDKNTNIFFSIFITSILIIIFVENFRVENDIGRMNTFFKFHLQSWILISISSCFFIYQLYKYYIYKNRKILIYPIIGIIIFTGIIYPIFGTLNRIDDRFISTKITLDGSKFLEKSTYNGPNGDINLSSDYDAIMWIKNNIIKVPIIIEGNGPLYSWSSRFSIYTGLPSVIGWDWHQIQQRGYDRSLINIRINDVDEFYSTEKIQRKIEIIDKYNIDLVVIGNLERNKYPSSGINKIEMQDNLFEEIYKNDQTTILKIIK